MAMINNAAINRRFFKILLPGFCTKLSIPIAFTKAYCNNHKGSSTRCTKKSTPTLTLVNAKGKIWHAKLYKKRESLYIAGQGWEQLAAANGLSVGHALLLRYRGNMVFSFRVFDLSTCEKDDYNYKSVSQMEMGRYKGKRSSIPVCNEFKVEDDEGDGNGPLSIESSSKMNNRRNNTNGGYFVITVKPSHITQSSTFIRARYKESCGITDDDTEISVRDPMGEIWELGLYRRRGTSDLAMTRGWYAFAKGNKLNVGDKCIFELVSRGPEGKLFRVTINNKLCE